MEAAVHHNSSDSDTNKNLSPALHRSNWAPGVAA
jgi:hypothetical protein